jgi:heme exporter protein C
MCAVTAAAFLVPPARGFPDPELARIIFFHLPSALVTTVFAIYAAFASWRYLATRDWGWEFRALAATEIATITGVVTMLTGMLFARVQWGAWWHWDPRQTSFLIVLGLFGAYFALRMAFDEDVMRARVAAAYSTLTLLPILFLIFVFPRLPEVAQVTLHPGNTLLAPDGFSPDYRAVLTAVFALLVWMCCWLFRLYVRASYLEQKVRDIDGKLEVARDAATAGAVVRPVVVRKADRNED